MDPFIFCERRKIGLESFPTRRRHPNCLPTTVDSDFLLTKLVCNSKDNHPTSGPNQTRNTDPILACKFNPNPYNSHILAMANESGMLNILDTNFVSDATYKSSFYAHNNAIFDISWVPLNSSQILTACADKTACLWDIETNTVIDIFRCHLQSLRTADSNPSHPNLFATGSKDGCVMIWDSRSAECNGFHFADDVIRQDYDKKSRTVPGVTATVFQNENTLISTWECEGEIKVWDLRKHYSHCKKSPIPKFVLRANSTKCRGYSSLVLDSGRLVLYANCLDNVIYKFDCAGYVPDPLVTYKGHQNNKSYYVKTALSPDDRYLTSGCRDDCVYVWKISEPGRPMAVLEGAEGSSTIAWSKEPVPKIVTCGDDTGFKLWRPHMRDLEEDPGDPFAGKIKILPRSPVQKTSKRQFGVPVVSSENIERDCSLKNFESPTMNLPNSVLDGEGSLRRCRVKRKRPLDWLSQRSAEMNGRSKKRLKGRRRARAKKTYMSPITCYFGLASQNSQNQ